MDEEDWGGGGGTFEGVEEGGAVGEEVGAAHGCCFGGFFFSLHSLEYGSSSTQNCLSEELIWSAPRATSIY